MLSVHKKKMPSNKNAIINIQPLPGQRTKTNNTQNNHRTYTSYDSVYSTSCYVRAYIF